MRDILTMRGWCVLWLHVLKSRKPMYLEDGMWHYQGVILAYSAVTLMARTAMFDLMLEVFSSDEQKPRSESSQAHPSSSLVRPRP